MLGLLAAIANAAQALVSKELTTRAPARQLIGVLYAGNAVVLLPIAPFTAWRWSPYIALLHLVSVALMAATALCFWDLLAHGDASAATTATALSPIPAALAGALLLPGAIRPLQLVAAPVVVGGVLVALADAFGGLGRRGTALRILGASAGTGLLTVASRLLGDAGSGVVETYVVRTTLAAAIFLAVIPPRQVSGSDLPRLFGRSLLVTIYFVLVIVGAQQGSPLVIQTLVATTPVFLLIVHAVQHRSRPPARGLAAAFIVVGGVLLTVAG